jgi:hypothetical protein
MTLKRPLIYLTTILFTLCLTISYSAAEPLPKKTDQPQSSHDYLMTIAAKSGAIVKESSEKVLIIKHADELHITFFQNNPLQLTDYLSNERLATFWRFSAHDIEISPPQAIIMIGKHAQTAQIKEISINRTENRYVLFNNNKSIQPITEDEPAVITILLPEQKVSWWCLNLIHCKHSNVISHQKTNH